jgi:hypothetical protein
VIYPELREVARCLVAFDSSTSTGPTVARISVERDKNRARLSRHMSEERWHVVKTSVKPESDCQLKRLVKDLIEEK